MIHKKYIIPDTQHPYLTHTTQQAIHNTHTSLATNIKHEQYNMHEITYGMQHTTQDTRHTAHII